MLALLWLVPISPLVGYLLLTLLGSRLSRTQVAAIGVGSVGLSALVALLVGLDFIAAPPPDHTYVQTLWSWIKVGDFQPNFALHLDPLSLVMTLVVTFVGFLIHLYSAEFMTGEQDYGRFFL
jgi:NADH-quinone oxidoreductase subunit L